MAEITVYIIFQVKNGKIIKAIAPDFHYGQKDLAWPLDNLSKALAKFIEDVQEHVTKNKINTIELLEKEELEACLKKEAGTSYLFEPIKIQLNKNCDVSKNLTAATHVTFALTLGLAEYFNYYQLRVNGIASTTAFLSIGTDILLQLVEYSVSGLSELLGKFIKILSNCKSPSKENGGYNRQEDLSGFSKKLTNSLRLAKLLFTILYAYNTSINFIAGFNQSIRNYSDAYDEGYFNGSYNTFMNLAYLSTALDSLFDVFLPLGMAYSLEKALRSSLVRLLKGPSQTMSTSAIRLSNIDNPAPGDTKSQQSETKITINDSKESSYTRQQTLGHFTQVFAEAEAKSTAATLNTPLIPSPRRGNICLLM